MRGAVLLISSVLLLSGVAGVLAHGGATGIVKERMDGMGELARAMKTLGGMMRGDVDYDAAAVRAQAQTIKAHSGQALTRLFPEGSISGPSEARQEIWSDWARFAELSDQLGTLATALDGAADKGLAVGHGGGDTMHEPAALADMPPQGLFEMMAQTFSACHKDFRLKKH